MLTDIKASSATTFTPSLTREMELITDYAKNNNLLLFKDALSGLIALLYKKDGSLARGVKLMEIIRENLELANQTADDQFDKIHPTFSGSGLEEIFTKKELDDAIFKCLLNLI